MIGTTSAPSSGSSATAAGRFVVLALAAFVVGYNVTHHSGLFYGTNTAIDGTRVADWLDMLTPFIVLGPLAAVVGALHGSDLAVNRWVLSGAGALCGLTWATNGLEGGTAVFSLVLAVSGVAYGIVHRRGLALPVGAAGIVATLTLGVYGLWHAGFPQPSEL